MLEAAVSLGMKDARTCHFLLCVLLVTTLVVGERHVLVLRGATITLSLSESFLAHVKADSVHMKVWLLFVVDIDAGLVNSPLPFEVGFGLRGVLPGIRCSFLEHLQICVKVLCAWTDHSHWSF